MAAPGPGLDDFILMKVIGKGSYGKVMLVRHKSETEDSVYAMKMLRKENVIKRNQVEHTKTERNVLEAVSHPFIVTLYYAFQTPKKLYFVLEYCPGGELFFHLSRAGRFSEGRCRFYASEILLAIEYLHKLNIIYRDLKPENILLDADGHVKLTDFGLSKEGIQDNFSAKSMCGTPEYLAPEVIQSKGHGLGVDWWTLGILLFEILAGYPPFYDDNPFGIYKKVLAGQIEFPGGMELKAKDLIKRLLMHDQGKRLGCLKDGVDDVKRHKYYKGLDWDLLGSRSLPPPFIPPVSGLDDVSMFEQYPESMENDAPPLSPEEQRRFEGFLGSAAST
mmetsp:Transcript_48049/g.135768  ORF Transcript_48049/g.135768 Transcript_48049/m.135768 type:complete len:333 (+) Transcript_48049:82-1080(+)